MKKGARQRLFQAKGGDVEPRRVLDRIWAPFGGRFGKVFGRHFVIFASRFRSSFSNAILKEKGAKSRSGRS